MALRTTTTMTSAVMRPFPTNSRLLVASSSSSSASSSVVLAQRRPFHHQLPPPPRSSPTLHAQQQQQRRHNSTSPLPPTPPYQRELPDIPSRRPWILLTIALAITSWTGFTLYATNLERLSSSAFRACLTRVKEDDRVKDLVGEVVRVDQKWYLGGKPWVKGTVNMMQGRVDVSFRIKGDRGAATVYFTTFRPTQHANFENLRFVAVGDDGQRISLL